MHYIAAVTALCPAPQPHPALSLHPHGSKPCIHCDCVLLACMSQREAFKAICCYVALTIANGPPCIPRMAAWSCLAGVLYTQKPHHCVPPLFTGHLAPRYYDKLVHNLDDRAKQQHWHRPWLGEWQGI